MGKMVWSAAHSSCSITGSACQLSSEQTCFSHGIIIFYVTIKQSYEDILRRKRHESLGTIHSETKGEEGRTEGHRRQETARPHGSPSQPEAGIGTQRRRCGGYARRL